jgi:FPC/CPF motif-containing protein YcgG
LHWQQQPFIHFYRIHCMEITADTISRKFLGFLRDTDFPCVAAKHASEKEHIKIMVADHFGCPKDDREILSFLYNFTEMYRKAGPGFYSAAVIFKQPGDITEEQFDMFMWQRLNALRALDAVQFSHDSRVSADPASPDYSFSLMEEAFFIIGLHPQNSRAARRFEYPVLVFNPHAQFTAMKKDQRYEKMKTIVRKRDLVFSGSVNPMLTDFGEASEIYQYSGRKYEEGVCPVHLLKE